MDENKQIEEMARTICGLQYDCNTCAYSYDVYFIEKQKCSSMKFAEALYKADYRKQIKAEWIPHRFDQQGKPISWYCSNCKAIGDHGTYCSHCGARMKGAI